MSVSRQPPPGAVLGAILIVIGLGFLAVRYLDPRFRCPNGSCRRS